MSWNPCCGLYDCQSTNERATKLFASAIHIEFNFPFALIPEVKNLDSGIDNYW